MSRMEIPSRYCDKRVEIGVHVVVVFTLFQYQLQHLRELSTEYSPYLRVQGGVDMTDTQWRDFRGGLPLLTAALTAFVLISLFIRRYLSVHTHRIFYAVTGLGYATYLHGAYAVFPFLFSLAFYLFCHAVKRTSAAKLLIWGAVISFMFLVESQKGWYKTTLLHQYGGNLLGTPRVAEVYGVMRYQGVYRWHVGFNLAVLRLLSFGLDLTEAAQSTIQHTTSSSTSTYKDRMQQPRDLSEYSLIGMLGYVFYIPLYIAGPTTTYNAFSSHCVAPQTAYGLRYKAVYLFRWLCLLGLMEYALRHLYVWGLSKSRPFFERSTPLDMAIMGFFLLNFLWLKFAIIWRYARLFALFDEVEVPENMTRCMNNNFTVSGFWRNWHKSFNLWLVRYMYIPLGGKRWQMVNVFPIFAFVAIWHDMELNLVKWGVLMACFIVPEAVMIEYFSRSESTKWLRVKPYWRYLKATVGTVNITVLMTANLIGFGVGESTDSLLQSVSSMWWVVLFGFIEFFSATCIMIEVREWEAIQEEAAKAQ